jgi:hypothetical protein
MKIYVSGPMTGFPEHNLPAFAAAAKQLAAAGFDAVDPGIHGVDPAFAWTDYLRRDLVDLCGCEAVALLPEWERSRGAQLEVHVARALEMPVKTLDEWLAQDADGAA